MPNEPASTPGPLSPETFFHNNVAPQFSRRIEELRQQIRTLEQQLQDRLQAQVTVRVVVEGDGGGVWHLNTDGGEMTVSADAVFPPLMTVYQSRAYFDWAAATAADAGVFGPGARNSQGELTKSRIERLKMLKGLLQFTFTHLPDGGERSFCIQLGTGERPSAPQTVLTMKAEDGQKMAHGELTPHIAFMSGAMKVTGDLALAMQFGAAMM
ncbi:MAG: SCP2 sterol-binding domain-containing protein [Deltaproteobacteria bacterium]|nr:SCP2 sterol-binding domain-containing protein [Deltaproteobacteria bacterium]